MHDTPQPSSHGHGKISLQLSLHGRTLTATTRHDATLGCRLAVRHCSVQRVSGSAAGGGFRKWCATALVLRAVAASRPVWRKGTTRLCRRRLLPGLGMAAAAGALVLAAESDRLRLRLRWELVEGEREGVASRCSRTPSPSAAGRQPKKVIVVYLCDCPLV
jgi:hypothetical protein